ncbi:AraC-like ligand binding domain-containing protein [Gordonia malaquae]|uniref:Putative AraC family transcriptional regulator n=1 Tax=Gordonia malaquae NBRC 108250 TaxID=1223542 RepID=M3THD9_GORML|nr:helix-turn-helix transcriptional regulator [Gordonia malaquae]GAC80891.1 putative AraC family transcriptional regulator [Gordonia malaquae NBRC 108250]SED69391.1 AraC-like ligand binding domain-containing protein [Gordonia malaquae]
MDHVPGRLATLVPENSIRFLGHPTHSHPEPHLVYVSAGSARLEIDGEQVVLGPQESVWLAPDVPHAARYAPGSLVLGPLLSPTTIPPERVHRLGVRPSITTVMTALLGAAPSTAAEVSVFREALDNVLTTLGGPYFALPSPTHPVAATVAREIGLSTEPLDEIAARHGVSTRHLQRLFVAETGIGLHQWRVRSRLNVAIDRLRHGATLTRAAHAAGYSTGSGLRKALHREAGVDVDAVRHAG